MLEPPASHPHWDPQPHQKVDTSLPQRHGAPAPPIPLAEGVGTPCLSWLLAALQCLLPLNSSTLTTAGPGGSESVATGSHRTLSVFLLPFRHCLHLLPTTSGHISAKHRSSKRTAMRSPGALGLLSPYPCFFPRTGEGTGEAQGTREEGSAALLTVSWSPDW